jgi:hypothetical protein
LVDFFALEYFDSKRNVMQQQRPCVVLRQNQIVNAPIPQRHDDFLDDIGKALTLLHVASVSRRVARCKLSLLKLRGFLSQHVRHGSGVMLATSVLIIQ